MTHPRRENRVASGRRRARSALTLGSFSVTQRGFPVERSNITRGPIEGEGKGDEGVERVAELERNLTKVTPSEGAPLRMAVGYWEEEKGSTLNTSIVPGATQRGEGGEGVPELETVAQK